MSMVKISDKRGGVFQVMMTFTYGECARLPFNSLRKVRARIDQVPNGGISATADFNLRNPTEAQNFVEVLDLFGEDGSYVHGSPADPDELGKSEPDEDGPQSAAAGSARGVSTSLAVPSPETEASETAESGSPEAAPVEEEVEMELEEEELVMEDGEEPEDLKMESFGEDDLPPSTAIRDWERAGDEAVAAAILRKETKEQMLARVREAAGRKYNSQMVRQRLIELLLHKFKDDAAYVAAFLQRRGWDDIAEQDVLQVMRSE